MIGLHFYIFWFFRKRGVAGKAIDLVLRNFIYVIKFMDQCSKLNSGDKLRAS